ncbi:MAG: hypothetical protein JNL28_08555 [Planctomycetes bacterium]|nr:hypothetical protein [Planctomycetota bacterium]
MRTTSGGDSMGLAPGAPVDGFVAVPASKSIAQRALILGGLAAGTTRLTRLPDGDDVRAAEELVRSAGSAVENLAPAARSVTGRPPGPHRGWKPTQSLSAGESGTLARLATATIGFCALAGHTTELTVHGTLARRKSAALFASLRASGVALEGVGEAGADAWPVRIRSIGPPSSVRLVQPTSSQEVSALLAALSAYPDATQLEVVGAIPSRPYLDMTLALLARFGARVTTSRTASGEVFDVRGPLTALATPLAIEPDASAAAVALAAGCLSGGTARVRGLGADSLQGDVKIVEHLQAFGCRAGFDEHGVFAAGPVARAADLDLEREPDLAPVIAALAARAALAGLGTSHLRGLATLPGKESSRIEVLAQGLRAIGLTAQATSDALTIGPGTRTRALSANAPPIVLDPHGDHRMAFAFALFGLCVADVSVCYATCVAKSWPTFWSDLERAGANVVRSN